MNVPLSSNERSICSFRFTIKTHFSSNPAFNSFGANSRISAKTPITTNNAEKSATLVQKLDDDEYRSIRPFEVAFWIVMSALVIAGFVLTAAFSILGKKRFWE
jgi:hypothetical protein